MMEKINNNCSDRYLLRKEALTSFFLDKKYIPMTKKQIAGVLSISKQDFEILDSILNELQESGAIYLDDSKRYCVVDNTSLVKCVYQAKNEKFGFAIGENSEDIHILSANSLGAMNGDEILVKVISSSQETLKQEGLVVKVLKRNTKKIIGRFQKNNNFGFVEPIDKKIADVYIPKKETIGFKNGLMVEACITKYPTSTSKAEGRLTKIIASGSDETSEVKALFVSYGLDMMQDFSFQIKEELKNIPSKVLDSELENRVDRTNERVYTIDASDAKDLDDAVQVKKIGEN